MYYKLLLRSVLVVYAALTLNTGCDTATTEPVTLSFAAATDTLRVLAGGVPIDFVNAIVWIDVLEDDFKIRAQRVSGEAFSLDINNVDGPATHFVSPISGKSASSYFIDSLGTRYVVRERSSQTVRVTRFDGTQIAGTMDASAVAGGSLARRLDVYFSFRLSQ